MQALSKLVSSQEFTDYAEAFNIYFAFNKAAAAPWFSALAETMVNSTKKLLRKTIKRQLLDIEDFRTLLKSVQGTLNTRPLTLVSTDHRDLAAITPSDLLFGYNMQQMPHFLFDTEDDPSDLTFASPKVTEVWKRRQKLSQHFKRMFIETYVNEIRLKHLKNQPQFPSKENKEH